MPDSTNIEAALADTSNALRQSAQSAARSKASDRFGSTLEETQATISTAQEAAPGTLAALQLLQPEMDKVNRYSEYLMDMLDDLQQIHPFVSIAVLAFKTAIRLELARRENDKRVLVIRISINDLFNVLLLIKDIPADKKGQDGLSIESRLKERIINIAADIKECSKACDTFQSKRKITKFFKSFEWEKNFEDFIAKFKQHQDNLQNDLTLYIGIEMKQTHNTLVDISKSIQATDSNTSMILLLQLLRSPKERELQRFIKSKGGAQEFLKNDALLQELIKESGELDSKASSRKGQTDSIQEIKRELNKTVSQLISENLELFLGKFDAQQEQLRDHVDAVVRREGDRITDAMEDGPHRRIVDLDFRQIWKEMASILELKFSRLMVFQGWKSTVKGRPMVMALREYYSERRKDIQSRNQQSMRSISAIVYSRDDSAIDKVEEIKEIVDDANQMVEKDTLSVMQDDWALEYITISRIQPLLEAIDDDSSSLISVAEVNTFITARPTNWSLPHWMAFWTAGFPLTLRHYYTRIQILLWFIEKKVQDALQVNRQSVKVFVTSWRVTTRTDRLLAGVCNAVDDIDEDHELFLRFKDYVDSEEKRMQKTLHTLKYRIDAENTLRMVTGPGRLDKSIMPLLYLLFVRVYQVVSCAAIRAIDPREVSNIVESFGVIHDAIQSRVESLKAVCKVQNFNLKEQLRRISYGIFYYIQFQEDLPESKYWTAMYSSRPDVDTFEDIGYDIPVNQVSDPSYADIDAIFAIPSGELLYSSIVDSLDVDAYDESDDFASILSPLDSMATALSSWSGFYSYDAKFPAGIIHLPLPEDDGLISGSGSDSIGEFSVAGKVDGESIAFNKHYTSGETVTWRYQGRLNADHNQMIGNWGPCDTVQEDFTKHLQSTEEFGQFQLDIAPLGIRKFVKVDADLASESNSPRERWRLAVNAVLTLLRIKKRNITGWTYMQNRRHIRRQYLELFPRLDESGRSLIALIVGWRTYMSDEETEELLKLVSYCSRQDFRFYRSLSVCLQRRAVVHWNGFCDIHRDTVITDTRFICLDCLRFHPVNGQVSDTLDLCTRCVDRSVDRDTDDMHHTQSHDMLQLRYCCSTRREGPLLKNALEIAKRLRSEDVQDIVSRNCYQCNSTLERPYWYCLICPDHRYICMSCKDKLDSIYSPVLDMQLHASDPLESTIDASGYNAEDANNDTNGPSDVNDSSDHPAAEEAINSGGNDVDRTSEDGEDRKENGEGEVAGLEWLSKDTEVDDGDRAGPTEDKEAEGNQAGSTQNDAEDDEKGDGVSTAQDNGAEAEQPSVEHICGHTLILCRAAKDPPAEDVSEKPSIEKQLADMEARIMERLERIIGRLLGPEVSNNAPSSTLNESLHANAV